MGGCGRRLSVVGLGPAVVIGFSFDVASHEPSFASSFLQVAASSSADVDTNAVADRRRTIATYKMTGNLLDNEEKSFIA